MVIWFITIFSMNRSKRSLPIYTLNVEKPSKRVDYTDVILKYFALLLSIANFLILGYLGYYSNLIKPKIDRQEERYQKVEDRVLDQRMKAYSELSEKMEVAYMGLLGLRTQYGLIDTRFKDYKTFCFSLNDETNETESKVFDLNLCIARHAAVISDSIYYGSYDFIIASLSLVKEISQSHLNDMRAVGEFLESKEELKRQGKAIQRVSFKHPELVTQTKVDSLLNKGIVVYRRKLISQMRRELGSTQLGEEVFNLLHERESVIRNRQSEELLPFFQERSTN